jgi:hypothetical protein
MVESSSSESDAADQAGLQHRIVRGCALRPLLTGELDEQD